MRIINIQRMHSIRKWFYPRLLIIRNQAGGKSNLMQMCKKLFRLIICRCSMCYQCIINIKNQSPVSGPVQPVKINLICRGYIQIRIKFLKHKPPPYYMHKLMFGLKDAIRIVSYSHNSNLINFIYPTLFSVLPQTNLHL